MNQIKLVCLGFVFCISILSCGNKKKYNGDSIMNYPDMELLFKQNLEPFQKPPYTFKLISNIDGKKDSSFLKANEVNWDDLKQPFLKANLFQEKLDKHYSIEVFTDTLLNKRTMLLTSLDPKAITSKMSITSKTNDNKILTIYAETRDAGFFMTREYKLLFVNGKTLQVQELKKNPFMKIKKTIKTLTFLN